jgi:hypothetical protein
LTPFGNRLVLGIGGREIEKELKKWDWVWNMVCNNVT